MMKDIHCSLRLERERESYDPRLWLTDWMNTKFIGVGFYTLHNRNDNLLSLQQRFSDEGEMRRHFHNKYHRLINIIIFIEQMRIHISCLVEKEKGDY